jgi:hypothetical protein
MEAVKMKTPKPQQSCCARESAFRTGGNLRVQYDPKWCRGKPYATFKGGTAGAMFKTFRAAANHLAPDGKAKWGRWR